MLVKREFLVIGMGRFGMNTAIQLEKNGCKVLAVDNIEENIRLVADQVTRAVCVDVTDPEALSELGVSNFDCAIVAIGQSLEPAVLATMYLKEAGVPRVIVKIASEIHGEILKKVGADEVIYPEQIMGVQLADNLSFEKKIESIALTDNYSIACCPVKPFMVGKDLNTLKIRQKYNLNVIALKRSGKMIVPPPVFDPIRDTDEFYMIGTNEDLSGFEAKKTIKKKSR